MTFKNCCHKYSSHYSIAHETFSGMNANCLIIISPPQLKAFSPTPQAENNFSSRTAVNSQAQYWLKKPSMLSDPEHKTSTSAVSSSKNASVVPSTRAAPTYAENLTMNTIVLSRSLTSSSCPHVSFHLAR